MAISPDGSTLFVGGAAGRQERILAIPVANPAAFSTWIAVVPLPDVRDLAVSPDGTFLYALVFGGNTYDLLGLKLPLPPNGNTFARGVGTSGTALTVSPDGQTVYTASHSGTGAVSTVQAFSASSGTPTGSVNVPMISNANGGDGVEGISISPDGSTLLAFGINSPVTGAAPSGQIYPVRIPGLTLGPLSSFGGMTFTVGPQNIATTPDQAPVANVAPTSGAGCTPTTISAGASSVVYGSIVRYVWNFGDGQTAVTSGPAVQHTYNAANAYTVTVTETDSAGTSVPPAVPGTFFGVDGPGQTPFKRASNSAQASAPVAISSCGSPPPPPPGTTTTTKGSTTTKPTTKPGQPKASTPKLILNPIVGSPGTIVTVTGTGFRANTPITISWSVSTGSIVVTSDPHGNLAPTPLPILIPDVLGPRFAVASSSPQAKAAFLVVPGTAEPGGDQGVGVYLFRAEGGS
jgi:hypothetical protein